MSRRRHHQEQRVSDQPVLVETKDLSYRYPDGTCAIDQVSLCLREGVVTALLGANGAGKSTLFLSCNGTYKPSSGTVSWRGTLYDYSRSGLRGLRQQVGMVFQDPDNQLFSASVEEDISFGAVNLGLPPDEVRRRVSVAMEQTGVSHLKAKPTHCLSYGQKKRVAIAGVLVMQPRLIILDEPTAGLDPMGADQIMKLLMQIRQDSGIGLVVATHDIDLVSIYADHVAVMDHGRLALEGTPATVFGQRQRLRELGLRLPRIGHLMELLHDKDGIDIDLQAMTISSGRQAIKSIIQKRGPTSA